MNKASTTPASPSPATPARWNGWLIWKELRLLSPLLIVLVGASLMLLVGMSLLGEYITWPENKLELAFMVIPGLFATGIAAIMVGQEREQRTLGWQMSLPITPRQLMMTKFITAFIGLAVMWLVAILLITVFADSHSRSARNINSVIAVNYGVWIVNSIFLMSCGFYTSWRIESAFRAIMLLIPIACLPLLLAKTLEIGVELFTPHYLTDREMTWISAGSSFTLAPLALLAAYRA